MGAKILVPHSVGEGYAGAVGLFVRFWKNSRIYDWLRLKGYVAFDLPNLVTALGGILLISIAAAHAYVVTTEAELPTYFKIYSVLMIIACVITAGGMWWRLSPRVPHLCWLFGDLLSVLFIGVYAASRVVSLRGLVAVTGRWDFAPGTFALAFAGAFLALHMSVLLRINVAYPDRQGWQD
jgi:hypothetical protein